MLFDMKIMNNYTFWLPKLFVQCFHPFPSSTFTVSNSSVFLCQDDFSFFIQIENKRVLSSSSSSLPQGILFTQMSQRNVLMLVPLGLVATQEGHLPSLQAASSAGKWREEHSSLMLWEAALTHTQHVNPTPSTSLQYVSSSEFVVYVQKPKSIGQQSFTYIISATLGFYFLNQKILMEPYWAFLNILTVDMKQWSRFSSENRTPSLMKTALALRMKEKNRLMWM